jgi:hypothetical protein
VDYTGQFEEPDKNEKNIKYVLGHKVKRDKKDE